MQNADRVRQINYLMSEMDSLYHQAAVKLGLSDSAVCVLYAICEQNGSCLLSDIYKQSGISKQTINSALRKLETEGILYLELYKGNAKKVSLTPKGTQYVNDTVLKLYEAEIRAFASWSEEEMETYIRLIKKDIASLKAQLENMPQVRGQRNNGRKQ